MDVLLLNAIAFVIVFIYSLHKYKRINVYNATLLAYTIIAILGYVTTKMGIQLVGAVNFGERTSALPYICMFISVMIIIAPLKKLNTFNVSYDELNSKYFKRFITFSIIIYAVVNIIMAYKVYMVMQTGLAEAYLSRRLNGEELIKFDNFFLNFFVTKGMTYVTATFPILAIYFLNNIVRKMKPIKNLVGLVLSFTPSIMASLCAGSKGMLFFNVFDILFFYLVFERFLSKATRRFFISVGVGLIFVLVTYAVAIQDDRNSTSNSNKTVSEVMLRYLGETMPNLGDLYKDIKVHPYGKHFFPYICGGKVFDNPEDGSMYWERYTHARLNNFHPLWGGAYAEFGLIGSFFFIFIVVFLYNRFVFSRSDYLYIYPLIYFYYNKVCIYGIFGVAFVSIRSLQVTLYAIFLSVFLYKVCRKKNIEKTL